MTGFLHNALEHAETYRAAAIERSRKSGGSTVTVYTSSRTMDAARGGSTDGFQAVFVARQAWQIARDLALQDYLMAAFPERAVDLLETF